MKRKLRLDELSVTSFSTDEDAFARRGTIRGMQQPVPLTFDASCVALESCDNPCQSLLVRTCANTCNCTVQSCPRMTCEFTCYATCPE